MLCCEGCSGFNAGMKYPSDARWLFWTQASISFLFNLFFGLICWFSFKSSVKTRKKKQHTAMAEFSSGLVYFQWKFSQSFRSFNFCPGVFSRCCSWSVLGDTQGRQSKGQVGDGTEASQSCLGFCASITEHGDTSWSNCLFFFLFFFS